MNAAATSDMLKVPIGANHLFYGAGAPLWRVMCQRRGMLRLPGAGRLAGAG
jgi:hypothetical protein